MEPQVFDLLVYLIRNRERVVSRDDLLASVWHGRIVSEFGPEHAHPPAPAPPSATMARTAPHQDLAPQGHPLCGRHPGRPEPSLAVADEAGSRSQRNCEQQAGN